jgi:NAD(P)-dependent dehydrogenase (short-subunit alcohol dehydrogenase family)
MTNIQRVAVITGASQGIGEGLVSGFRKLGYAVVANSRTIADSDDPMVLAVPGDVAQPGVGQRIVDAALRRFGRIDTVVNNAGIFIPNAFTDYTDGDFDAITGVNLRGFFEVSRAAIAAMLARGEGGHVVNISTSLVDHANSAVPSALASLTKGGLDAVTRSLAIEYADKGIRVNAVAPGPVWTPLNPADRPAEEVEDFGRHTDMKRPAQPEELSPAYVFLAAPCCASYITGIVLPVTGSVGAM